MRSALVVVALLLVANVAAFAWWRAGPGTATAPIPSTGSQFEPGRIKVIAVQRGEAPAAAGGDRPTCAATGGEGPGEPCAQPQTRPR